MDSFNKLKQDIRILVYKRGLTEEDFCKQVHALTAPAKKAKKSKTREEPEATGYDREG